MNEGWLFGGFIVLLIMALLMAMYPLRHKRRLGLLLVPMIVVGVVIAYWHWGALLDWQHHRHQQASLQQLQTVLKTVRSPDELIEKLKARLLQQPNSERGWYLLGRLYGSQGHWQLSHDAFLKAHRLNPNNEQTTINYGQSLWQLNHRAFNKDIRLLFQSVLKNNKNQPDTLAMLAMDAFVRHADTQAIAYWQRLLYLLPPQSDDANAIRKAIAKAQQHLNGLH